MIKLCFVFCSAARFYEFFLLLFFVDILDVFDIFEGIITWAIPILTSKVLVLKYTFYVSGR